MSGELQDQVTFTFTLKYIKKIKDVKTRDRIEPVNTWKIRNQPFFFWSLGTDFLQTFNDKQIRNKGASFFFSATIHITKLQTQISRPM